MKDQPTTTTTGRGLMNLAALLARLCRPKQRRSANELSIAHRFGQHRALLPNCSESCPSLVPAKARVWTIKRLPAINLTGERGSRTMMADNLIILSSSNSGQTDRTDRRSINTTVGGEQTRRADRVHLNRVCGALDT